MHQTDLDSKAIKVHGIKIKWKDMELISMPVERFIRANGKTINSMEKEFINFRMEQFTRDNGKIISCMEQDFILIQVEENGKGNIEMESLKQKGKSSFFSKDKLQFENSKLKSQ
jgi:hypothetical protein